MDSFNQLTREFNRFELKYLISLKQAQELKRLLRDYMLPDPYGGDNGCYGVTSLYYDSPQFRCYWEKENGIRVRRKLRLRHYDTGELITDETPIFLEIKQRVDRVVKKRRVVLSYITALQLCNDRQMPGSDLKDQAVLEEAYAFIWQYNLVPTSIVRYNRQTFVGAIYDAGLRVTFDSDLAFQVHPLHLHEVNAALPMLAPDKVVMEIKVNDRIPTWLTEFIAAQNLKMIRISKYCSSIEKSWNMPAIKHRSLLPESSEEVLASSFSVPIFWKEIYQSKEK